MIHSREASREANSMNIDQSTNFGGFVEQTVDPEDHKRLPLAVRANQLVANVAQYRETVIRDGIPFRWASEQAL